MGTLLRAADNQNQPIIAAGVTETDLAYFNLLRLREGESARVVVPGYETLFAVLSGRVDVAVGGEMFEGVGGRPDVWSGQADSVYAGTGAEVVVTGRAAASEAA